MASDSDSFVPTLSNDDVEMLNMIGRAVTQDAVGLIWETVFLSAYGVFFGIAVYSIIRKGVRTISSCVMLSVVIYLYATSLTLWGLNVTWWFTRTRTMLQSSSASLEERKYLGNASVELLGVPMESLFMFNMVVGDTVVIWRAWVLYPKKQLWAIIIPCFILLMSFIFAVIQVTCLTGAGWGDHSASALGGPVCEQAGLIAWAFSFVTNATCTILISIKAWQHRRMMRSTLGHRTATEKVLTLLVESGFVYCLFWLTQLTIFFDIPRTSPLIYVYFLCAGMGDQISGMYPTLIIVIVNLHRSALEVASSSSRSGSVLPHGASSAKSLPTAASFNSQRGHKIHLDSETELGSMGAKGTSSYAPPGEP